MKKHAEESLKTKKARAKLEKRLKNVDGKITPEALSKKGVEIQRWISRHADRRISLKEKSISLFDENQNVAKVSAKVSNLAEKLRLEL